MNNKENVSLNSYIEELNNVLSKVSIENLKLFCKKVLLDLKRPTDDETLTKYNENIRIVNFMIEYLKARKLYNELRPNKQTDAAIVSILLHNVYCTGEPEDWQNVFTLRRETSSVVEKEYSTPDVLDVIQYIYQVVEAQLGELMPVPANRPVNGQITYMVWEVLWFYKNHDKLLNNKE